MPRSKASVRVTSRKRNSTAIRLNSAASGSRLKRSRTHRRAKYRGPKISRTRLQNLREDLDNTRNVMSDTVRKFWIISEHDIRKTLAKTEQKIGRAVNMLSKAA